MIYIIIFLSLILLLFLIPIKVKMYYELTEKTRYKIKITYLFGLIKKEIDSTRRENIDKKVDNKFNIKGNHKSYVQYIIDKGHIQKIDFKLNIGFEDPSLLGISFGIVWAIVNVALGYFLRNKDVDKIEEKDIQINPIFNMDIFEMFFLCIISVNLVYIIIAYIRTLKEIREGGESIARTSNRRLNENYNE